MIKIIWYGTASLIFESESIRFVIDPFLKLLPEGIETKEEREKRLREFRSCKNVLLTHGHLDHMGSVQELYGNTDAIIYATEGPAANLRKKGFDSDRIRLIAAGDDLYFNDIHICVHRGKHVKFDLPLAKQVLRRSLFHEVRALQRLIRLNGQFPEYGETVLYEIHYQEKKILVLGSADLDEKTKYPVGADILVLPHQGRSDITIHNYCLIQKLKPKQVYIDHYDNSFPPMSEDVDCDPLIRLVHNTMPFINIEKMYEGEPLNESGVSICRAEGHRPHTDLYHGFG